MAGIKGLKEGWSFSEIDNSLKIKIKIKVLLPFI